MTASLVLFLPCFIQNDRLITCLNIQQNNNYGKDIKDIPRSTWNLLTNKIYMVTCMGACMELIIVSGFIVFLPKYLETQFNLGKSEASMFTGGIAIPGACIGIFLGGYLLKRMQLRPLGAVQVRLTKTSISLINFMLKPPFCSSSYSST